MSCGHELIDTSIALTSYPPKYRCNLCGEFVALVPPKPNPVESAATKNDYREFWKQCALASLASGQRSDAAEDCANKMLIKYKNKVF